MGVQVTNLTSSLNMKFMGLFGLIIASMVVLSSTAPAPIFPGLAAAATGGIIIDATGLALAGAGTAFIPTSAIIAGKVLLAKKALLAAYIASQNGQSDPEPPKKTRSYHHRR